MAIPRRRASDNQRQGQGGDDSLSWLVGFTGGVVGNRLGTCWNQIVDSLKGRELTQVDSAHPLCAEHLHTALLVVLILQQGKWKCRRLTGLVAQDHDYQRAEHGLNLDVASANPMAFIQTSCCFW